MNYDSLSPFENSYFYRTACFTRQGHLISLADINNLNNQTMLDAWFSQIFALADGQHTVSELYLFLRKGYQTAPTSLRETIVSNLYRMVEGKLIRFSDEAVAIPYHVSDALNELDLTRARTSYTRSITDNTHINDTV